MVTREKKEKIKKLIKDNVGWARICEQAHCSPNTIAKIIDQGKGKAPGLKGIRTRALKMFDKGNCNFDVAIKLDISAEETENHKLEYVKLKRMDEFESMYKSDKAILRMGLGMAQEIQARGITEGDFIRTLGLSRSITQLHNEKHQLEETVKLMREDYRQRQCELWNITNETTRVSSSRDENRHLDSALRALIKSLGEHPDPNGILTNLFNGPDEFIIHELIERAKQVYGRESDEYCKHSPVRRRRYANHRQMPCYPALT
jgi:hypothetical protein